MKVQRLVIIAVLGLSLGLAVPPGAALAQGPVVYDDASGTDGCRVSGTADERLTVCTDLSSGNGVARVDPGMQPSPVVNDSPPAPVSSDTAPAPAPSDLAVATASDRDADNVADELEPGLGLDPANPDTDGDNVADGDEPNIYGTDALNPDTDGDGFTDGQELFATYTDPLVPDAAA